jgi:hypothetical protein
MYGVARSTYGPSRSVKHHTWASKPDEVLTVPSTPIIEPSSNKVPERTILSGLSTEQSQQLTQLVDDVTYLRQSLTQLVDSHRDFRIAQSTQNERLNRLELAATHLYFTPYYDIEIVGKHNSTTLTGSHLDLTIDIFPHQDPLITIYPFGDETPTYHFQEIPLIFTCMDADLVSTTLKEYLKYDGARYTVTLNRNSLLDSVFPLVLHCRVDCSAKTLLN